MTSFSHHALSHMCWHLYAYSRENFVAAVCCCCWSCESRKCKVRTNGWKGWRTGREEQTDRLMDGRTDGRTYWWAELVNGGRVDGWAGRRKMNRRKSGGWTNGREGEWTNEQMRGWMDGWQINAGGQMDRRLDRWAGGQTDRWASGRMDGLVEGWTGGPMDERMRGWMDGGKYAPKACWINTIVSVQILEGS